MGWISGASLTAFGDPIKVAVIDTGFDFTNVNADRILCKGATHINFVNPGTTPNDTHGHGTHISGIIDQYARGTDYCQIIYKYYDPNGSGEDNLKNTMRAIQAAIDADVDFINYSAGGAEFSQTEYNMWKKAMDLGITVVVAAGNDNCNLDTNKTITETYMTYSCSPYFPASYYDKRFISVGNLTPEGPKAKTSNYGKRIKAWEVGTKVLSWLPFNQQGYMTGTSQATAVRTGKMIRTRTLLHKIQ